LGRCDLAGLLVDTIRDVSNIKGGHVVIIPSLLALCKHLLGCSLHSPSIGAVVQAVSFCATNISTPGYFDPYGLLS
jgi:hypothetical protein